jgi:hypothetical protein
MGGNLKTIIAGDREIKDIKLIEKAVKKSGFDITEVVSGAARGVDTLGEDWAKSKSIPIKRFPADWNNLKADGAVIKVNSYGKKYNVNAGFARNEEMAKYADALIAIQTNGPTSGTQSMIKLAKKYKLKIYIYEKDNSEYEYIF